MLTDKRLEYCTAGAPLQWSGATKWMMQADKHGISGVFRLDIARAPYQVVIREVRDRSALVGPIACAVRLSCLNRDLIVQTVLDGL
jgi:hypothetical protein